MVQVSWSSFGVQQLRLISRHLEYRMHHGRNCHQKSHVSRKFHNQSTGKNIAIYRQAKPWRCSLNRLRICWEVHQSMRKHKTKICKIVLWNISRSPFGRSHLSSFAVQSFEKIANWVDLTTWILRIGLQWDWLVVWNKEENWALNKRQYKIDYGSIQRHDKQFWISKEYDVGKSKSVDRRF